MMQTDTSCLLNEFDLKPGLSCRNRIAMAAMTHYSAPADDGVADPELRYIARRAAGPGIVFTACVAVDPGGKAYDGEPGAYSDAQLPGLARWAQAIREQGARAILQLHHGGGVCPPRLVPDGDVVSPSGIPTPERSTVSPRPLRDTEVDRIVEGFAEATVRAIKAGFDGVEIHGGYGYLPQQFLSRHTNRRDDRWGGSWERRCAFPLALLRAAQEAAWDHARQAFAIGYRFTPEEGIADGLTMDEAIAFTDALIDASSDFIDVLVNDFRSPPRQGRVAKDRSRLAVIAEAAAGRVPVLGGGSIYTASDAVEALSTGIDIVTLGRALVIEPEWVQRSCQTNAAR